MGEGIALAHVALYREWRPQLFVDVVGQIHITRTLQNALMANRFSHAYLFAGPRGTGKTSVARILAKAVNCLSPQGGEPDNACASCQAVKSGQAIDIIEIDAASNRGIDEIRDLRDKVKYAPVAFKYKVYIIDEVHMLTEPAFNALLKTLEEPPDHVIFILATTEAHKVPITIRSRCQRHDFHRLSVVEIAQRLQEVCRRHGFAAEEAALAAVARQAEGGMRDALSLLDQLAAYVDVGTEISLDDALAVLGAASADVFIALGQALAEHDAAGALLLLSDLVRQGKDLRQFVRDFLGHLRDLLIVLVSGEENILDLPRPQLEALRRQAVELGKGSLVEAVQLFATVDSELRYATNPRVLVEIALIRLAGVSGDQASAPGSPRIAAAASGTPAIDEIPAVTPELEAVIAAWPQIMELFASNERAKPMLPFLRQATPYAVVGRTLTLGFPDSPEGRTAKDRVSGRIKWVEAALERQKLPLYQVTVATVATAAANPRPDPAGRPDLVGILRRQLPPGVPVEVVEGDGS